MPERSSVALNTIRYGRCAGVALMGCLLILGGCAAGGSRTRKDDLQLTELQARLPGRYDNSAQVRNDLQTGVSQPHTALDLLIAPVNAALVGKLTYYVRETAAGDPRRVLSQRIWVLGHAEDLHTKQAFVEQHVYLFKDPRRWVRVGEQPELLEALLPEDLERLPGCEVLWSKKDTSYLAHRKVESCAPPAGPEGLAIEQTIELHDNQLALKEQQVTADGLIDEPGAQSDPFYRFVRRGAAN